MSTKAIKVNRTRTVKDRARKKPSLIISIDRDISDAIEEHVETVCFRDSSTMPAMASKFYSLLLSHLIGIDPVKIAFTLDEILFDCELGTDAQVKVQEAFSYLLEGFYQRNRYKDVWIARLRDVYGDYDDMTPDEIFYVEESQGRTSLYIW